MERKIVISALLNQVQVGIVENRRLVEYYLERDFKERLVNNIYRGRIENILPGMGAAFVDIGMAKNAFLFLADLPPNLDKQSLKVGDTIMVQVVKEAEGTKAPRVKAQIALPGRYLVLLPSQTNIGISKQITDGNERSRLKAIMEDIASADIGVIVRTLAQECSREELTADLEDLLEEWSRIQKKFRAKVQSPLLYQDHDLIARIIRDLYDPQNTKIIVDSAELKERLEGELIELGSKVPEAIELYQGKVSIFTYLGIDKHLERAQRQKVWLDCGGYLIFDQTEALLSIDVNTGKYVGSTALQDTVLKTNLQAAEEIAHQLRLRNIGGIVIIDFIDMPNVEDKEAVLSQLSTSLGSDKTRTNLCGFTRLGLVELTRKKNKRPLAHMLEVDCPHCHGTGRVTSDETLALLIAMAVNSLALEDVEAVLVQCHSAVAAHLIGPGASTLEILEKQVGKQIFVRGDDTLLRADYKLETGSVNSLRSIACPVKVGDRLTVEIEESHLNHPNSGLARMDGFVIECLNCKPLVGHKATVEVVEVHRTSAIARLIES